MNEEQTHAAAADIRRDWSDLRNPPGSDTPAAPGAMPTIDPRYQDRDRVPYWPLGESRPVVTDHQGWNRTRFLDATPLGRSIVISFAWPSDSPQSHTYLMIVDVAEWSVDNRLTSTVIWSRLTRLLAIPDWTTKNCVALSPRLSVATLN